MINTQPTKNDYSCKSFISETPGTTSEGNLIQCKLIDISSNIRL
jgi:hypothetical protein